MNQRVLALIVILAVVFGGGFYAYRHLVPPADETKGPVYATEPVRRGDITVGVDASGTLDPAEGGGIVVPGGYGPNGPLPGPSSYVIEEVLCKEGDHVKPGQVLVRLSASQLLDEIKTKQQKYDSDRQQLARMLGVSPDKLDTVDPARGITLRAPIDGRVTGLTIKEGDSVKQGQLVARVVNDNKFRLLARLVPLEYSEVSLGAHLVLKFEQFDGFTDAQVVDINPDPIPEDSSTLNELSGFSGEGAQQTGYQFVYYVTLEGVNAGLIRPGMLAQVGVPRTVMAANAAGQQVPVQTIDFFRYLGKVESYADEEQVLSQVEAVATKVWVHDMQRVRAGDALVTLAGDDAQEAVLTMMEQVRQEQRDLRDLQAQLDALDIKATMEGIVANIQAAPGKTCQPGEWLGNIFNTSNMRMWVQVDDIDVLLVQVGAPVEVRVDAVPGKTYSGTVEYVGMMGKDQSGITQFQVTIKVVGGPELRPGMQAKAHINAGSATGVLLVPLEAIFEEDGQPKVEVLLPNGVTKVVPVELGLMNDRVAEVKSGLSEGDLVITGSTADLLPSQSIQGESILPSGGTGGSGGTQGGQGGQSGGEGGAGPTQPGGGK